MISKRDYLLNRPWQERKFENHKRKVQSALPVVDNKSPPLRGHVIIKLKKSQKEIERIKNIEKENFLLLQKLNFIMKNKWVDNYLSPQPKFLNKVPMFQTSVEIEKEPILPDGNWNEAKIKTRKLICPACTPQKPVEPMVPEERVPWESTKKPVGRIRSKSVPAQKSSPLPVIKEKPQSAPISTNFSISALKRPKPGEKSEKINSLSTSSSSHENEKSSSSKLPHENEKSLSSKLQRSKSKSNLIPVNFLKNEPQRIILSSGSLKLAVNFPPDTKIFFEDGRIEKHLTKVPCHFQKTSVSA